MNPLLIRRRWMMQAAGGGSISAYVQNGLVFHLDAIERGNVSGAWTDRIGGHVFTNNGAIFGNDYVYFNGQSYMFTDMPSFNNYTNMYQIEVCLVLDEDASNGYIFVPKNSRYSVAFYIAANKEITWQTFRGSRPNYIIPSNELALSSSVNSYYGMCNGNAMTYNSSSYGSFGDANYCYLGYTNGGTITAKIHSIRIYNRNLSNDEVLQNLNVDNIRFNLGLTL